MNKNCCKLFEIIYEILSRFSCIICHVKLVLQVPDFVVIMATDFKLSENGEFYVTKNVQNTFDENGFILVRNLLNSEEVLKLKTHMEQSKEIQNHSYGREDGMGRKSNLSLWNVAGDDIAGIVSR